MMRRLILLSLTCAFASSGLAFGQQRDPKQTQAAMQKEALAPHSIMMSTALRGGLNYSKGLESQISSAPNPGSEDAIKYVRHFQKQIRDDLGQATEQNRQLQSAARQFPAIAASAELQQANTAIRNANASWEAFQSKLADKAYMKNSNLVRQDLGNFQNALNQAIDRTADLNKKLDIPTIS